MTYTLEQLSADIGKALKADSGIAGKQAVCKLDAWKEIFLGIEGVGETIAAGVIVAVGRNLDAPGVAVIDARDMIFEGRRSS